MKIASPLQTGKSLENMELFSMLRFEYMIMNNKMTNRLAEMPIHSPNRKVSVLEVYILWADYLRNYLDFLLSSSLFSATYRSSIFPTYYCSMADILYTFLWLGLGVGTYFLAYFLCFLRIFLSASTLISLISQT